MGFKIQGFFSSDNSSAEVALSSPCRNSCRVRLNVLVGFGARQYLILKRCTSVLSTQPRRTVSLWSEKPRALSHLTTFLSRLRPFRLYDAL